jgi:hypothetical protein
MAVWFVALLLLPEEPSEADSVWLHVPPMLYGLAAGILGMIAGSLWRPERQVETMGSSSR